MVHPTVFAVAVDGRAVGAVSVGSSTASNVAVGGWVVGTVVAIISALHRCHASKMLGPI